MNRLAALLALALSTLVSGCVAYPRVYWTTKKGQARVEDGKPIQIKAQLLRYCEKLSGDDTTVVSQSHTMTDNQGHYQLTVRGVAWRFYGLFSGNECTSRIQLFVCREVCKPADDIDINVLGK